jgi:hypothetical protein
MARPFIRTIIRKETKSDKGALADINNVVSSTFPLAGCGAFRLVVPTVSFGAVACDREVVTLV